MIDFIHDNIIYAVPALGIIALYLIFKFDLNLNQSRGVIAIAFGSLLLLDNVCLILKGLESDRVSWILFFFSAIIGLIMLYFGKEPKRN